MDELDDAKRAVTRIEEVPPVVTFNSLAICSNELGVLLPAYDNELMNALTDIYDCKSYSERRRGNKDNPMKIPAPQINLLAACTPSYLQSTLPEGAWDQGFLSRVILVYSGDRTKRDLFAEVNIDQDEIDLSKEKLAVLGKLYGKMTFTQEAADAIQSWHKAGGTPAPEHPKLQYYNVRRTVHALKLSMISAVSRTGALVIDTPDIERAIDWMLEAEAYMPDIFKSMTTGGTGALIEETWHFIYSTYMKDQQQPVAAQRIIHWLSMKAPVHQTLQILELMEKGGLLQKALGKTGDTYKPIKKTY